MFRSLHMKLVLIMVLLILSLMTVVGAFLMNSVVRFYLDDFYVQMQDVFGDQVFLDDLQTPTQDELEGRVEPVDMLKQVLNSNMGPLGIDNRTRYYYPGQCHRRLPDQLRRCRHPAGKDPQHHPCGQRAGPG